MSDISTEFTCQCGKVRGWITEGNTTQPCPFCGMKYFGKYNAETMTIDSIPSNGMLQVFNKIQNEPTIFSLIMRNTFTRISEIFRKVFFRSDLEK